MPWSYKKVAVTLSKYNTDTFLANMLNLSLFFYKMGIIQSLKNKMQFKWDMTTKDLPRTSSRRYAKRLVTALFKWHHQLGLRAGKMHHLMTGFSDCLLALLENISPASQPQPILNQTHLLLPQPLPPSESSSRIIWFGCYSPRRHTDTTDLSIKPWSSSPLRLTRSSQSPSPAKSISCH